MKNHISNNDNLITILIKINFDKVKEKRDETKKYEKEKEKKIKEKTFK